jgi:dihydrofolate reductase
LALPTRGSSDCDNAQCGKKARGVPRFLKSLQWNNSSLLDGDIVSAITALKVQPGHDLQIIGSGNLIQMLQAALLIDEYHVWMYPVVLGRGKRGRYPATMEK